jgi:hypothetical protein
MSLLRKTRAEVAGAWRSLRYDLGRRPAEPPADGPDVTSTGMSTFGVPMVTFTEQSAVPVRRPRRALAAGVFGMLTVAGAALAYLGVVNGLGSPALERPAAAETVPAQPPAPHATSDARVGPGPAPSRVVRPVGTPGAVKRVPSPTEITPGRATPKSATVKKETKSTNPHCVCGENLPIPTPTAPAGPTPAPSSASPSADASSQPSPSDASASPSDSGKPSESPRKRHRRHNR